MGTKILIDSIGAAELAQAEWGENKAFCEYCQVATLCSLASLALAVPEVMSAVRTLIGQPDESKRESEGVR